MSTMEDVNEYLWERARQNGAHGSSRLSSGKVIDLIHQVAADRSGAELAGRLRAIGMKVRADDPVWRAASTSIEQLVEWRKKRDTRPLPELYTNPVRPAGPRRPRPLTEDDRMWLQRLDPDRLTEDDLRVLATMERDAVDASQLRLIRSYTGQRVRDLEAQEERSHHERTLQSIDPPAGRADRAAGEALAAMLAPILSEEHRRDIDQRYSELDREARELMYLDERQAVEVARQRLQEIWADVDAVNADRAARARRRLDELAAGDGPDRGYSWIASTKERKERMKLDRELDAIANGRDDALDAGAERAAALRTSTASPQSLLEAFAPQGSPL